MVPGGSDSAGRMTNSPRRSARARPNSRPLSAKRITSAPGAARPAITALPRAPTRTTSKRGAIMAAWAAAALVSVRAASVFGAARSGGAGAAGIAGRAAWPALPAPALPPEGASEDGAFVLPGAPGSVGEKTPRQPRKTRIAKISSKAGMISFLAEVPPACWSLMLLSPCRCVGGIKPLPRR